jgi:uncharacterized protein
MPLLDIKSPGTYVNEGSAGINPTDLASFAATYMIGTSGTGGSNVTKDLAVKVNSVDDFILKFGSASPSEKSVWAYFQNAGQGYGGTSAGVLYFVDVTKAAATATSAEYVTSIGKIFDRYMPKGFVIAPQAFELLTLQADRTAVANTLRDTAATYNLLALVDSGPSTGTGAVDNFAKTQTEVALYTSERGHLAYYAGYIKDTTARSIPSSPFIAGIANRRYRQEGFNQPPAGGKYQLRGAVDTLIKFTDSDQEVLNPLGCNIVRNLYGLGVVCWGARTRSTEKRTQFIHERVILNILETTLQSAFDADLFSSIGSSGELLLRVQETITSVCYRLWKGGALFGIAPTDAYGVICDLKNNLLPDLQNGIVVAEVYVAITPIMERLFITVKPTAIGQVSLVVALVSGEGNTEDKKATEPKQSSAST